MPPTLHRQTGSLHSAPAGEEERPGPFTAAGFLIMLVMVGVAVVVTFVLVKPSPIAAPTDAGAGGGSATLSAAELMAPTVVMPEPVIVSIPVADGSEDLRTAVLSVAIRLGKTPDDKELDVDSLQKVYVPKIKALMPRIKHLLISLAMANDMTVTRLRKTATQEGLRENLKKEINDLLQSHGMDKHVSEVLWDSFHFE